MNGWEFRTLLHEITHYKSRSKLVIAKYMERLLGSAFNDTETYSIAKQNTHMHAHARMHTHICFSTRAVFLCRSNLRIFLVDSSLAVFWVSLYFEERSEDTPNFPLTLNNFFTSCTRWHKYSNWANILAFDFYQNISMKIAEMAPSLTSIV